MLTSTQPCTVRDFMNYLIYIEHSAENLQFFLWYRSYISRFEEVPECEGALSPEWTRAQEEEVAVRIQKDAAEKMRRAPKPADIFRGTDFEKPAMLGSVTSVRDDGFTYFTPPVTPRDRDHDSLYTDSNAGSNLSATSTAAHRDLAGEAYIAAGAERPFTIQPFRAEIDRVVSTYIADRSPRQLNLSSKEQKTLLHALSSTTHPSAFRTVAASIEATLRHQAHPNFIRWSICNGNPIRVTFARSLGAGTILLSTLAAVLLTLSKVPRGYRAIPAVGWFVGVATLIAAWKGMCVVLHGLHHRHVRPWELFEDHQVEGGRSSSDSDTELNGGSTKGLKGFDTFGRSNSYEDEPWVVKYDKRFLLRKIFDREVWIREPALRQIQDVIFVQAVLGGVVAAGVVAGVFVGVPGGNLF
ncbi:hypothetical protein GE09DRAFT_398666 [Coniochaeta sp. 2T2.1]|nr:hypothetical protein GE09DRAFT_398666 [Coniochaeta sp. 2T2.1]